MLIGTIYESLINLGEYEGDLILGQIGNHLVLNHSLVELQTPVSTQI